MVSAHASGFSNISLVSRFFLPNTTFPELFTDAFLGGSGFELVPLCSTGLGVVDSDDPNEIPDDDTGEDDEVEAGTASFSGPEQTGKGGESTTVLKAFLMAKSDL